MTDEEIFTVHVLQSENVRALAAVINNLNKELNLLIRRDDAYQVALKTKLLALMYSAWSEAQFLQITYTPGGFVPTEVDKIKNKKDQNGIGAGWRFMLDLAIAKVGDQKISADLCVRLQTLLALISTYIEEPAIIRNKIAHGQWIYALNRENTRENKELSLELGSLDPITIVKMFEIHRYLGYIVRDLVQSPKAGFHAHYWTNIVNLEQYEKKTRKWTINSKREKLVLKPIAYSQAKL